MFFDDKFEYFQNKKVRVQQFMSYNTNLVAIEAALKELKDELEAHRREAMLASDAPSTASRLRPRISAVSPELAEALANPPAPRRIKIPAERIPQGYWNGLPAELQERLNRSGATREDDIVTEIRAFEVEESNHRNQRLLQASQQSFARPVGFQSPASAQDEIRRRNEELINGYTSRVPHPTDPRVPISGPPIHIEIVPPQKGTP